MQRLTYVLLLLVAGTITLSAVRHEKSIPIATPSQKTTDGDKKIKERFPTADYDDKQDLPDPEKNAKRKAKQKRYNDTDLVASHVEPAVDEAALFLEPHFTFPALPVAESEIVVVGTIGTAQAILSESKRSAGLNMPQIGGRYLLFLTSTHSKEDISILTGYQLTPNGAIPLDELHQVASLTGVTEVDILLRVRNLIQKSAN